jgi:hypothetical protein
MHLPCPARCSSGEQGVAPVLAGTHAGGDREYGGAGVVDVLVQGVARQRCLELDELGRVLVWSKLATIIGRR